MGCIQYVQVTDPTAHADAGADGMVGLYAHEGYVAQICDCGWTGDTFTARDQSGSAWRDFDDLPIADLEWRRHIAPHALALDPAPVWLAAFDAITARLAGRIAGRPGYVYVASSWRNPLQTVVVAALRSAEINCYDFKHPAPGDDGFSWKDVGGPAGLIGGARGMVDLDTYLAMLQHPRAVEGYANDFAAMEAADTFVLVLPCGRSAHLELGWAVGAGKRTAILCEDPAEPELMYRMVDYLAPSLVDLLGWLGVED